MRMYEDSLETIVDDLTRLTEHIGNFKSWIKNLESDNDKMLYEVVIIWYDSRKDTFTFTSEAAAEKAKSDFERAFEDKITFICINKRLISF